jgi:hypothetical protein
MSADTNLRPHVFNPIEERIESPSPDVTNYQQQMQKYYQAD